MERGSRDDPHARATRGLRRPSLDARSWDHPSHPLVSDRSLRLLLESLFEQPAVALEVIRQKVPPTISSFEFE